MASAFKKWPNFSKLAKSSNPAPIFSILVLCQWWPKEKVYKSFFLPADSGSKCSSCFFTLILGDSFAVIKQH